MAGPLGAAELPTEAGQSAFAALAEIAAALRADENTDWSRVNLLGLREHLVDMDEVTLRAAVDEQPIEGGVRILATGEGRTLEALQRMIPMHIRMVQGYDGWRVELRPRPDGFEIDLTTDSADGVARLRGLGFFGFLAAGDHHRMHHLGVASGVMDHGAHHGG
jgi:hypothetical protein